ncbi:MAG: STAS domain-containing protein [Planctomycetes bacterium]|nr:STAS domain-containing protein [Planctomycetota bacterium]
MSIYRWSEDVILVDLPEALDKHHELQTVLGMLRDRGACDVVVDFSQVHVVGGMWLTQLQRIQRLVKEHGHKLVLCNVPPATRGIFTIAHLDGLFEFAEDRFAALTSPQLVA